jgi:hypothetical protein
MNTEAAQIRIQVAATLLEGLAPKMDGLILNIMHGEADHEDAYKLIGQLALVHATLAILRGVQSNIPDELRGSTIYEGAEIVLASDLRR